ncbi:hyaluronidase-2 [Denticeps clupeoides]|uniref:Hyaluronidase n=1 Tax=Denticeps clupeoides TaxID=299321 RepID=A0AAY4A2I2_9TELE|nr:hyaluronidase-2-like [Denticeps clupeoides]XP_028820723.1 hyaluronidase-2-like [Denticeps clupeoides]
MPRPWWGLQGQAWLILFVFPALWDRSFPTELKPTTWPLYPNKPLLLAWNVPHDDCKSWHGVHFKLDLFQIVASPNQAFVKQNLTIFYKDRLGLYPYYNRDGTSINGGIPQNASLTRHLDRMPNDVKYYIRDAEAKGLAVIDWEEWRPLWIRNWDAKDVYRNRSRHYVHEKNPAWTPAQVAKVAQQEFELSAKRFMLETLRLAKSARPNQLWGFYLFPDCYNHNYRGNLDNYTGRCPDVEVTRNDQLTWLWTECTALYPSVYMGTVLRSTRSGRQFVRNRVKEGMRLASTGDGLARPVFVYTRPTYINELTQLTEMDLVSTIGESVSLGAAGVILWGDSTYASSNTSCTSLNKYLQGPLGRYLLNVSTAAEECSRALCGSRGRCLRKQADTDTYLHLSPITHSMEEQGGVLTVKGQLGTQELQMLRGSFQCQCYSGFRGEDCSQHVSGHNRAMSAWQLWVPVLIFPLLLQVLIH